MADRNDIRISNNAAWAGVATILDQDGVPRNLSGAEFKTEVRASADAAAVLATLTTDDGSHSLSGSPADDGLLYYNFSLAMAQSLAPGIYVYDTLMTVLSGSPPDGEPELITHGTITVRDGVTEP